MLRENTFLRAIFFILRDNIFFCASSSHPICSDAQGNIKFEPRHEIANNVVLATSKGSDQPAHKRSLIRAFASPLYILWLLGYYTNVIWNF